MLPFSFNPLGYVEHKLTDTLETETAETIFNSVFWGGMLATGSSVTVLR